MVTMIPGTNWNDRSRALRGAKLWVHSTYRAGNSLSSQDIAVIQVAGNWTFSSSLGVVELASSSNCGSCESATTNYLVSGYGYTKSDASGGSLLSDTLKFVAQQCVAREPTCLNRLRAAVGNPNVGLTDGVVCAGPIGTTFGKDSCQGDSGGPLTVDQGPSVVPRYLQVGIVSTGTAQTNPLCGGDGDYGIYVRWCLSKLSFALTPCFWQTSVKFNNGFITQILNGQTSPTATSASAFWSAPLLLVLVCVLVL